jgi:pullulanase
MLESNIKIYRRFKRMGKRNFKKLFFLVLVLVSMFSIFGCKDKDSGSSDTIADGKVRIYYHRYNGDYDGWGLHLWVSGGAEITKWASPQLFNKSDKFGKYTDVNESDIEKGVSFIIHKGDTKDVSKERVFPKGFKELWLIEEMETVYTTKPSTGTMVRQAEITNETTITIRVTGNSADADMTKLSIVDADNNSIAVTNSVKGANGYITLTVGTIDFGKTYKVKYNEIETYIAISRSALQNVEALVYTGDDLGATLNNDGTVTLKLWSPPATEVKVYFYDKADQTKEVGSKLLVRGDKGVWSTKVSDTDLTDITGSLESYFYQYEVTAYGTKKRALDPYAKSMAAFKGNYGANSDTIGKSAVVSFNSSEAGTKSSFKGRNGLMSNNVDMVVYEVHVRDFALKNYTDNSAMSADEMGTFKGFIKNIPHLKELGVTHVQLLPIQNHYRVDETNRSYQGEVATPNFNWGYDPHSYFAIEGWYSTDATNPYKRIAEFRELVKELHNNGIGVIVDVVYNHTMNMEIFENVAPGCYHRAAGNTVPVGDPAVETRNPMVRKLVIDSLKMLKDEYGVDGFRFDLMGFIDSETMKAVRTALGDDVILQGEAWNYTDLNPNDAPVKGITDVTEHGVSDLAFFNDTSRDSYAGRMAAKGFIQGQHSDNPKVKAGLIAGIKGFTNGDSYVNIDIDDYNLFAVNPDETLQFISIHDGFTLWDKINLSVKGSAENRAKMAKQATAMLLTSQGKIILHGGDEIGRTKPLAINDPEPTRAETSGNADEDSDFIGTKYFHENSYRSSDYTNEFKWGRKQDTVFANLFEYHKGLIKMRRNIPAFRFSSADKIKSGMKFIGETAPEEPAKKRKATRAFATFAEMDSLKINFINGPASSTYYFAGETQPSADNPATNSQSVVFDANGNGSRVFSKAEIGAFRLSAWGAGTLLNFKLIATPGTWDAVSGAYTGTGNNNINPTYVSATDGITVDLSIIDHTPGIIAAVAAKFIAYELDNTLEPLAVVGNGTNYKKLIVIHNADTVAVTIDSTLITDAADWKVIMDEDDAGITALTYDAAGGLNKTAVKIETGKVTVPANSSAVIAVE